MFEIIWITLPLALAASISPSCSVLFIQILSGKYHQRNHGLAFILGATLATIIVIAAALFSFGHVTVAHKPHSLARAVFDFTLALLSLYLLMSSFLDAKRTSAKPKAERAGGFLRYLFLGLWMKIINVNTLPPLVGAIHEVAEADMSIAYKGMVYAVIAALTVLPMLIPYILFLVSKRLTLSLVKPIAAYVDCNKTKIVRLVLLLVMILTVIHGVRNLLSL